MHYSLPGTSVHGLLQARVLEWVAMLSSRDLPDPGVKPVSLTSPAPAGRFFTTSATWGQAQIVVAHGLSKAMATHSSTLAWKILWTEGPGRLQAMGSLGVGRDWATSLSLFTFMHWRRKWQSTPVLLPGESQGQGSLVGCRLWGRTESDTTQRLHFQLFTSAHWRRKWQSSPVLLPGESQGQRSLVGCSPWGREELNTTERLHFHFSLSCIGEGNGNPLQCSCLENPRDGGAWWAAVSGVTQSWTRLKWLSSSSSF